MRLVKDIDIQSLYIEIWSRATFKEKQRLSGIKRLRSFSLLSRIFLYKRFSNIRSIINDRTKERSVLVMTALNMVRELKLTRRRDVNSNR